MCMTELKIRLVTPSDLTELQLLFVGTVTAVCSRDYNGQQIDAWNASIKNTERWIDRIENQFFIVAQIGEVIVGFGTLEQGCYIDLMYVHKDFLRRGIGAAIYSELENEAIRQNRITLISDVSKTARLFFEKIGFKISCEKSKILQGVEFLYYKMSKELPNEYPKSNR